MVTRQTVLESLSRARLGGLARAFGATVSSRTTKELLIATLARSRIFTTMDLLDRLTLSELRALCPGDGTNAARNKADMIFRLTGDRPYYLKCRVIASLKKQGFRRRGKSLIPPPNDDKQAVRGLHSMAVSHKRERAKPFLGRYELDFISRIASGHEVDPGSIEPQLVEVHRKSFEELLFRYVCLHWSIPVSSGYGRRLRYLVLDRANSKLIGIIGLGDPVYALSSRDEWIGFSSTNGKQRLYNVMDAFVLGAVPPYSNLLAGKLVAMLAVSNEVSERFKQKYGHQKTLISGRVQDGELALITTTSALGRSSVYNRIRYRDRLVFQSVGFTRGFGDFQFLNGLYDDMFKFAKDGCTPTAKQQAWGGGFRNRREVVKKCLATAGLPEQLLRHGVQREVFVAPLAQNAASFLRGDEDAIVRFDRSVGELSQAFKTRWLLPRAASNDCYREFKARDYGLWMR